VLVRLRPRDHLGGNVVRSQRSLPLFNEMTEGQQMLVIDAFCAASNDSAPRPAEAGVRRENRPAVLNDERRSQAFERLGAPPGLLSA
jgi:hypothetical protein